MEKGKKKNMTPKKKREKPDVKESDSSKVQPVIPIPKRKGKSSNKSKGK
jgi:hypothetical protein